MATVISEITPLNERHSFYPVVVYSHHRCTLISVYNLITQLKPSCERYLNIHDISDGIIPVHAAAVEIMSTLRSVQNARYVSIVSSFPLAFNMHVAGSHVPIRCTSCPNPQKPAASLKPAALSHP